MGISPDANDIQTRQESLNRAQAGDGEAFCQLVRPLEQTLIRQAFALCHDAGAAEDLVSETLIEAWKSLARYDETCRLTTWLYSILLHRYHKYLRRARSRPVALSSLSNDQAAQIGELERIIPDSARSPAETVALAERNLELRHMIDNLADKHRQVVLLRFFEDASLPEIAAILKCSEGTVKSRLHHALKYLHKMKISMNLLRARGDT
jgi:RNA polymerase sigma-70 factor (ECF subfamily)